MFGFVKPQRDPLTDIKSAERWLATFPSNDPLANHAEVMTELARVADRNARRTPAGLEAVFHVDASTHDMRRRLTRQYIEHANRSSKIENQLWQAMFDLTQSLLLAYAAYAREAAEQSQGGKWQAMFPMLVARQLIHLGLDAKIRLFRCEQWIPAKWAELHDLFTLACTRHVERQQIALPSESGATTIEHEYLKTLALQIMNSGNLTPAHLDWVTSRLDEWCAPLRLTLEPSTVTAFYVDLGHRAGLRRRAPAPLEGRVLFLDTRPLHSLLQQKIVVLEQKVRREPLSAKTTRRVEHLTLLTRLAAQIDPEFRPFARRGERTAATGKVDAIVGFGRVCEYLREEKRSPVPELESGTTFGATMDLAVFGHIRNESDRRRELERQRLSSFAAPGGAWDVRDVSQTGFRLIAPMNVASAVTLGTLAAIRAQGQTLWALGIVRRMKRMTAERAEIGLQVIANTLVGVELVEQRGAVDADYSVDGESTVNGRPFHGLFLALRKRNQDASVQSLIVPAAEFQPAKRFRLQSGKSSYPIRFGRLLEQQPDWAWVVVEPLALQPSARGVPAAAA